MAKLADEIRDREIRDVAVRNGVTIMEWAILVDMVSRQY
jgi:hypothetical protein